MNVGVQLPQQHCTIDEYRRAWREVDRAGFDSLWVWDHFFPLSGDRGGSHFEGWSLLAAMAADTSNVHIGNLVTCTGYRNPDLLADMARTVDHLSGGRTILGIGAGGHGDLDYAEYGYPLGDVKTRVHEFAAAVPRIKARLARLNPPPVGRLPIMIAAFGEQVMLRLVAEHADMWNVAGPIEDVARKSRALDAWCEKVGRDPGEIERTVLLLPDTSADWRRYADLGFQHLIFAVLPPFDLDPARRLLDEIRAGAAAS